MEKNKHCYGLTNKNAKQLCVIKKINYMYIVVILIFLWELYTSFSFVFIFFFKMYQINIIRLNANTLASAHHSKWKYSLYYWPLHMPVTFDTRSRIFFYSKISLMSSMKWKLLFGLRHFIRIQVDRRLLICSSCSKFASSISVITEYN